MTASPDRLILDTNILLSLLRGDSRGSLYAPHLAGRQLAVSFQTVAEWRAWAIAHAWGEQRRGELERYLRRLAVFSADDALRTAGSEIKAAAERKGRPISPADAWGAASAVLAGLSLVTHNRRDLDMIDGLILISEAP